MMARRGVMGVLAGAAAAVLGGCGVLGGEKSYRFRMTVEVETPQGLRTGSSVMEITSYKTMKLTSEEHAGSGSFRGEAVVVDRAAGPLFALLKNDGTGQPLDTRVTSALSEEPSFRTVDDYVAAVGKLGGMFGSAKAELPRADWPMMVRFRNLDDPKSVERVDPEAIGVKRIVVETTSDDVTRGIEKIIPWIDHLDRYLADPSNPFTSTLPEDFGGFRSGKK